ncbi:MAG: flagellar export chaperone FliS [Acidobacteria bacterium]|nr:flagellar export chaperone FliS [Acidobacteriota bacterium]
MRQQGLNAYRRTEVQSRTPIELVVMLYDGALRFVAVAQDALRRRDIPARREATSRLLAIVSELQSTLDLERGGEVAARLDGLYDYVTRRILDVTAHNDEAALDEVRRLLETLRDGWQALARTATIDPMVAAVAARPAGPQTLEQTR